jgi:AraC-like DNA-binding protein
MYVKMLFLGGTVAWQFLSGHPVGTHRGGYGATSVWSDLDLRNAGEEICRPSHRYAGVRDHFIIHLVLRGRGSFTMDGERVPLGKGGLFFIPPGVHTEYQADDQKPWHYTWVGFSGPGVQRLGQAIPILSQGGATTGAPSLFIESAFGEILHEFLRKEPGHELRALGHFHLILSSLPGRQKKPERPVNHVEAASAFLLRHHTLTIDVGQVSESLGLERTYLSALYHRSTGTTLNRALEDLRLSRAEKLLRETALTTEEVARSCGYEEGAVFMKMFKRRKGMPCGSWRKQAVARDEPEIRASDPSPYGGD